MGKLTKEQWAAIFSKMKSHGPIKAYDVKAKEMAEMVDPKLVIMKNGRGAATGKSKKSGIAMFRILPSEA